LRAIFLLLLSSFLFSKIYFMPLEGEEALKEILKSIRSAKFSIKAAIYTFTNKKIANEIKKAARRGVNIEIIFDKQYNQKRFKRSMLYYLAKYKNIDIYLLKGKPYLKRDYNGIMHIKAILIDNKKLIFGSANWTYGAFKNNYEIIYSVNDYKAAKKFENYFELMKKESVKFE